MSLCHFNTLSFQHGSQASTASLEMSFVRVTPSNSWWYWRHEKTAASNTYVPSIAWFAYELYTGNCLCDKMLKNYTSWHCIRWHSDHHSQLLIQIKKASSELFSRYLWIVWTSRMSASCTRKERWQPSPLSMYIFHSYLFPFLLPMLHMQEHTGILYRYHKFLVL